MKRRWRGIYSLHTKSNHYTQFTKLSETESVNLVTVSDFGGTDMHISRTDMVRVRA